MGTQTYLIRKGAKYHFRRRLPSCANDNATLTVALYTADPAEARRLARRLAVRWDDTVVIEGEKIQRGNLTVAERRTILRAAMEDELSIATADLAAPSGKRRGQAGFQKIMAGAYAAILQVTADANSVPDEIIDEIVTDDWSAEEGDLLRKMLASFVTPAELGKDTILKALKAAGAGVNETTIHEARASMLRGMIEAQNRATLFQHPLIQNTGDPVSALLDDQLVLQARATGTVAVPIKGKVSDDVHEQSDPPNVENMFFARTTEIRFSEQIEELLRVMFEDNSWQPDNGKTRHMLEAFAWLTGDKRMSDYEPADIDEYVRRLARIPKNTKWGRLDKSEAMAEPFDPEAYPAPAAHLRRNDRTINSHISKLATASTILKKTHWLPKQGFGEVMNFTDARKPIKVDESNPSRLPLTEANLIALYGLPLWQGGGGCHARLKPSARPTIYQDGAYWVPLFGTYAGMSREEACGVETIDFEFDVKTPYMLVQANMTKSKDGQTAGGLKRTSRRRALPIHPQLLRLGLRQYWEVIRAEGWEMMFPELYGNFGKNGEYVRWKKPGGSFFYARSWAYQIDAAHAVLPLPKTSTGKHADFHSQRTFHYSAMAAEGVSNALLARHFGHSSIGTGDKNYNRRALALGEERELAERLKVLSREVPNVTSHIPVPTKVNLLHLNKRSRVGSAPGRSATQKFLA